MKPQSSRFAFVRGSGAAAVALVGFLAACEAKLPTESDIKQMDVASAERSARQLELVNATDTVRYVVDGVVASKRVAERLSADSIMLLDVVKSDGGVSTISIRTKALRDTLEQKVRRDTELRSVTLDYRDKTMAEQSRTLPPPPVPHIERDPMFIVDGVRTDPATFAKLSRDRIAAVDVIKGKAAAATYGPDADHGVIVVTTKK